MPALSATDWVLLAVLALSLAVGLWRGLVREVLALMGWVAAFYLAQLEAPRMAQWLPMSGSSATLRYVAGFVVVFVAVLVLSTVLAWLIRRFLSVVGLGVLDRLLGGVFGLLRGGVILLVLTVVVSMTPLVHTPTWTQSWVTPWLANGLHHLKPLLPTEFGKFLP